MKGSPSSGDADSQSAEPEQSEPVNPIVSQENIKPHNIMASAPDVGALQRLGKPLQSAAPVFRQASNVVKVKPLNQFGVQAMLGDDDDDIIIEVESNGDEGMWCYPPDIIKYDVKIFLYRYRSRYVVVADGI